MIRGLTRHDLVWTALWSAVTVALLLVCLALPLVVLLRVANYPMGAAVAAAPAAALLAGIAGGLWVRPRGAWSDVLVLAMVPPGLLVVASFALVCANLVGSVNSDGGDPQHNDDQVAGIEFGMCLAVYVVLAGSLAIGKALRRLGTLKGVRPGPLRRA